MSGEKTRTIQVNYLARVEGEGRLRIQIKGKKVTRVELSIFEPPRLFEAFLRGRKAAEAPDLTSRICGICPVAYQMSACRAVEDALGIQVDERVNVLRRLLYCGEWIESHSLHVYMLHAPDFLRYPSGVHLAKDHPQIVQRGLGLKKAGNAIMTLLGGREIHPINVRIGGFYAAPEKRRLRELLPQLEKARDAAEETVRWVAGFSFPEFETDYEYVALRSEAGRYPIEEGKIVSSGGLEVSARQYEDHFEEKHVKHSTALQSHIIGRGAYFAGPMARMELNFDRLSGTARSLAKELGFTPPYRNPFQSIVIRSLEILYVCEEAIRLINAYEPPEESFVGPKAISPRASTGFGVTEAPRGLLYHRYRIEEDGIISEAKIVPPTSQNQMRIEEDLRQYVESRLALPREELAYQCEQAVRNYDPCISCATHFLDVRWEES
jgi:coenzyme F420-reducing hydrogenase alpha subunit